jgi:hypothetical protein
MGGKGWLSAWAALLCGNTGWQRPAVTSEWGTLSVVCSTCLGFESRSVSFYFSPFSWLYLVTEKVMTSINCGNFRCLDEWTHLNDPLALKYITNRRKIRRFPGTQVNHIYIAFPKKKIIRSNELNLIPQHIFNSCVSYQFYIIFTDRYNFTALKICLFLKRYCFLFVYLFSLFSLLSSLLIIPHWTLCNLSKSVAKQPESKSEGNQNVSLILTEPLFGMFCLCSGKVLER